MSAIDRLLSNYSRQVRLPWAAVTSGKQRVWFAVHPAAEERRMRARLPQFEAVTLEADHGWSIVELTRLLPEWISAHEYREAIFERPSISARTMNSRIWRLNGCVRHVLVKRLMPAVLLPLQALHRYSTSCGSLG